MEGSFLGTQVYLTESGYRKHDRPITACSRGKLWFQIQQSNTKQTEKKKTLRGFNPQVCTAAEGFRPIAKISPWKNPRHSHVNGVEVETQWPPCDPHPTPRPESTAQTGQTLVCAAQLGQTLLDLHCLPRSQLSSGSSCVSSH